MQDIPRSVQTKEHWFGSSLWDIRLQTAWILFAAAYLLLGSTYQADWISSLAITLAGILILAILCHTLIATDNDKSRSTLLVSLAACIFLIHESTRTFNDNLGSFFAAFFAAMIILLLWLPDSSSLRERLKETFILVMATTIVFSLVQLFSTITVKKFLDLLSLHQQHILIAPHIAGVLSGICAFLLLDKLVASSIYPNRIIIYPRWYKTVFYPIVLILSFSIVYVSNKDSLHINDSDFLRASIAVCGQMIISIVVTALAILSCIQWKEYRKKRLGIILVVLIPFGALVNGAMQHIVIMETGTNSMNLLNRMVLIELLPMYGLLLSAAISYLAFAILCRLFIKCDVEMTRSAIVTKK